MFRFACNGELDHMKYNELDKRIIEAITNKSSPLYNRKVSEEATRIAALTERESFRVTDCRLQALRKGKKIQYVSKLSKNGAGGWILVD